MITSFIDLATLGMFLLVSIILTFVSFGMDYKAILNNQKRMAAIFLVAGLLVFFSDTIVYLQDKEFVQDDPTNVAKAFGVMALSPFYGVLFAAISWFSRRPHPENA